MTTSERLEDRQRDRQRWLTAASAVLDADASVVAAWLWGSEGRGDADALSDYDLFVAVAREGDIECVHERFGDFGDVQWCREVPFNAPTRGRYFTVGYPAAVEPLPIDWYWQPAAHAVIGTDTRVLIEKTPIRRVAVETFATFTPMDERPSPHPDDPIERLNGLLQWFWSMYGPVAKKIARGQTTEAAEQVGLLDGVLALSLDRIGEAHRPVVGDPLEALQALAERMEAIGPALRASGATPPDTTKAWRSLQVASDLVQEGWRR